MLHENRSTTPVRIAVAVLEFVFLITERRLQMTDQKENTSVFEKHLPNAPSRKPVVSERGQKEPVNRM